MKKILLLGSGELGREVVIELVRLGCYVVAADRYENAPAHHFAHESVVVDMTNKKELQRIIDEINPDIIVPEIEAIATDVLLNVKAQVVPSPQAVDLTMNREGIRVLADKELNIPVSKYRFASSFDELKECAKEIGYPVVIKPVQSSSGKGQSVVKNETDLEKAWKNAIGKSRGKSDKVIVEEFINFEYEVTLLTIRASNGVRYLDPIGHTQIDGDYRISWQSAEMGKEVLKKAQKIADSITEAITKDSQTPWGLFGVELFVKGDDVIFSEVSPRPHDTGMVTMITQEESEFMLHAKALLGIPVYKPKTYGPGASYAIVASGKGTPIIRGVSEALGEVNTSIRVFGKPSVNGERRIGVTLARGKTVDEAIDKAIKISNDIEIDIIPDKKAVKN